ATRGRWWCRGRGRWCKRATRGGGPAGGGGLASFAGSRGVGGGRTTIFLGGGRRRPRSGGSPGALRRGTKTRRGSRVPKGEGGRADWRVRTWEGWHPHQTLSLLATWFLTQETRRGKHPDAGAERAAGAGEDRWHPEPSAGLPSASADSSHEEPPIASQRRSPALSLATTEPPAAPTVSPTVMTDTVELKSRARIVSAVQRDITQEDGSQQQGTCRAHASKGTRIIARRLIWSRSGA